MSAALGKKQTGTTSLVLGIQTRFALATPQPRGAQVGELGVLRFGGAGAVAPLHALGRPFTDADGPRVLAQMRFVQARAPRAHMCSDCHYPSAHLQAACHAGVCTPASSSWTKAVMGMGGSRAPAAGPAAGWIGLPAAPALHPGRWRAEAATRVGPRASTSPHGRPAGHHIGRRRS